MAETVTGGCYQDMRTRRWVDANGQPVPSRVAREYQELQAQRASELDELNAAAAQRATDNDPVAKTIAGFFRLLAMNQPVMTSQQRSADQIQPAEGTMDEGDDQDALDDVDNPDAPETDPNVVDDANAKPTRSRAGRRAAADDQE